VRGLGELEADVMERLWAADGDRSVREVLEEINTGSSRPLAYTTVMTVLDNLHRKGWLTRQLVDRAYRYRPVKSKQQHSAALMADALASSGDRAATLLAFLAQLDGDEAKRLADLVEQSSPRSRRRRGRP
jgi:predicted transcriptional regulator